MHTNQPIISVVICSYNRADYIINAIESLYNQTLPKKDFEVFVVDNNSIDNTEDLVQAYIREHEDFNIVYLTESAQGASFARNTGAAFSKGKYLCFMDDDAVAEEHYLERIVRFFLAYLLKIGQNRRALEISEKFPVCAMPP